MLQTNVTLIKPNSGSQPLQNIKFTRGDFKRRNRLPESELLNFKKISPGGSHNQTWFRITGLEFRIPAPGFPGGGSVSPFSPTAAMGISLKMGGSLVLTKCLQVKSVRDAGSRWNL